MHLIGERLYVVDGAGLRVIDVSNPRQSGFLGALETPGEARGLYVEGGVERSRRPRSLR